MLTPALILSGVGLAARVPWPFVVLPITFLLHPGVALALLVGFAGWRHVRHRQRTTPAMEATFYYRLLSEMQSGISLRSALGVAVATDSDLGLAGVDRRLKTGADLGEAAGKLAEAMPHTGDLARVALQLGALSGGSMRSVVADLATTATDMSEVDRQVAIQTAQARLSALVVGVLPVAVAVGLMLARGGLGGSGIGRTLVVVGLGLEVIGLLSVAWLLRRRT